MAQNLDAFIAKWAASGAAERANKDSFLNELCDVLDVARPNPTVGDPERDSYVFERKVPLVHEDSDATLGSIDLYKQECFVLEAKQASGEGQSKLGKAKRGTPQWNILMKDAYGQALGYARAFDRPPPFVVVCDIGHCFDLYAAFDGSTNYRAFPDAQNNRVFVSKLGDHRDVLRAIFERPLDLDPSKHAARVTREVAGHLANLAKKLEDDGHDQTLVAQFLMRCLFTMFAEDVGLLPDGLFTKALKDLWIPHPESFPGGVQSLWRTMNEGGEMFGVVGKILRFNGGLFASPKALKLDKKALELLLEAGACNWSDVEPAIFGTLLERALDPKERHALGAHYTPRAYVERLVRPTIEEPLRADWDVVQAQVRRLVVAADEAKTPKAHKDKLEEAREVVREFQNKLCHTRVLDPACGSGNFLYVTLDLFKRLEGEVLGLLASLGETQTLMHMQGVRVTPEQFHGIEVKRWAKEIAELVLWIGYLQWHFRMYGKTNPVPEPVLRDYKNIECRDAVLAWDGEPELVRDEKGKPVTRWDGESMKVNPVTGEEVPDETKRVEVYRYKNPRKAEWPEADFIVGNPPFLGKLKALSDLGEGYVEALRSAYVGQVPDGSDLVMYWWFKASMLAGAESIRRFGLITTNSITQPFNRRVVAEALSIISLRFAIPDHPWVDSADGAQVRIAMTVGEVGQQEGVLRTVQSETATDTDEPHVDYEDRIGVIHSDLSVGADVTLAIPLRANGLLASTGLILGNRGFVLDQRERTDLERSEPRARQIIFPLRNGKDLTDRPRANYVLDTSGWSVEDLQARLPAVYQRLLTLVYPERQTNRDPRLRRDWWLFRRSNEQVRAAIRSLPRFVATSETAKHRVFVFLSGETKPEHKLVVIGTDDAALLGMLSSRIHVTWALAAGSHLGVGNDPVYAKTSCFEKFPFPTACGAVLDRIRILAEELDAHRKRQQAAHPDLTITGMYNVLEKLRSGETLNAKEKVIHEQGLVSVLKKLHDDLDAAVFDAYGWPHDLTDEQILERLVVLNAERAAEERRGLIRWLRPDFQNPQGKAATSVATKGSTAKQEKLPGTAKPAKPGKAIPAEFSDDADETGTAEAAPAAKAVAWPKKLPEQIAAVRDLLAKGTAGWTVAEVADAFKGAKKSDVEDVLDSLAALGIVTAYESRKNRRWTSIRTSS